MQTKNELRQHYKNMRDSLSQEHASEKSLNIIARLKQLDVFQNANTVMCYTAFRSEVLTLSLMQYILQTDKKLLLPVTTTKNGDMHAQQIYNIDDLTHGNFGILEPEQNSFSYNTHDIDIILVPGLAFNRHGYRIGYGKGYYDRFLPSCINATTIMLAYSLQECGCAFQDTNDIPMNYIITDKELICCE